MFIGSKTNNSKPLNTPQRVNNRSSFDISIKFLQISKLIYLYLYCCKWQPYSFTYHIP